MEDDEIKETLKGKAGPELFRELLRQYPPAFVEDYYKHGVWQNDLLRLDIQILNAHRLEAGAPDLPPASEVKMPEIPEPPKILQSVMAPQLLGGMIRPAAVSAVGALRPGLTAPLVSLAGMQTVAPPGVVMPPGVVAPPRPGAVTSMIGGSSAAADLRQIALFISKWRIDPARSSALLMRLSPLRRNFVMQNFKDATVVNGAAVPVAKLEEYIVQCEKSGAWAVLEGAAAAATAPALGVGAVVAPPAKAVAGSPPTAPSLAGLKRSFDQTLSWQAALPKNAGPAIQSQPAPPVAKMRPTFAR